MVSSPQRSPADTCTRATLLLESDSEFWHGGEQGERCEHNGLVEDCEIAVCQGKTRGQLWAPIVERVGRDSWKEAPSAEQRKRLSRGLGAQTPVCPSQLVWPFDPNVVPPLSGIALSHTCIKVIIKGLCKCLLFFPLPLTSQRFPPEY